MMKKFNFLKIKSIFKTLLANTKAVASIEFALIFPLMATVLLGLFDTSIAISDSRRVDDIAQSTAQVAASFPSFDRSARASITRSLDSYQAFLNDRELDVELVSLKVEDGEITEAFNPTILRGASTGQNWEDVINKVDYVDGDVIIVVMVNIENQSYFSGFFTGPDMKSSAQTQPYNSRSYDFDPGTSSADYFNWQ